jgi:hypothetical protein
LLAVKGGELEKLIADVVDSISLLLDQRDFVTKVGEFDAFEALKSFQNAGVLRAHIPLNDVLDEADLFDAVLQSNLEFIYLCSCAMILSLLSTRLALMASDR